MSPDESQIISRMESLIKFDFDIQKSKSSELIAWANNVLTFIKTLLPPQSYQINMLETKLNEYIKSEYLVNKITRYNLLETFKGTIIGFFEDYKEGFLIDLRAKIRADVDANFLSQAHRLLEEKLEDPAAMLIGAVLEDTLRQLCIKNSVPEGPNIESMNVPLRKANVYQLPTQQLVTAWAAIRNKADHGHFDDYSIEEVRQMHLGVSDFTVKFLS